ncbi:hypothetical protein V7793_35640, partial [Streptomyces sp. KLMMK]
ALRTCREAVECARQAGDDRMRAAVLLRLADMLERLGDPGAAGEHRAAAGELLVAGPDGPPAGPGGAIASVPPPAEAEGYLRNQ